MRTVPSGLVGHGQKGIYSVPRICVPGHGFHGQKLLPGKRGSGSDPVPGDSKAPSTLSYLEAEWIRILSGNGEPLEPTLVREDGSGGITVISGVLKQLENRVLKWDKKKPEGNF